jgi:hypothetical protein
VESRTQAFECAYAPAVSAKASVRKQEINRPEDLLEVEALLAGGPLGILHLLEGSRSPGRTTEDASRIPLQVWHGPRWLVSFRPLAPGTLQTWRPGTRVARTRRCSEAGTRPCGMRPVTSGSTHSRPLHVRVRKHRLSRSGRSHSQGMGRVVARPKHYLMIAGHQRSEGEEIVGSLHAYEIARKPG